MASKYFSGAGEGPSRPHLSKGEVADLRRDVEAAFARVEADMLSSGYVVDLIDAANVTGGGTTQTVGFQVKNASGAPIAEMVTLEFAAFDDAGLTTPAANATLATAVQGTILAGSGTAALKVRTNATGLFTCTLTDPADETVYLACAPSFGSPSMDCKDVDSVAFSA